MLSSVVLAFLLAAQSPQDVPRADAGQLHAAIAGLGQGSSWNTLDELERRFGCSAVPVLAGELHTVPATEITAASKARDAEHMAWVIAALRYITGEEFTGAASAASLKPLSENARYFLTLHVPKGEARIVALWPSRGTIYIGPVETQARVIEKWRAFAKTGQCRPSKWDGRRLGTFFIGGQRD